MSGPSGHPERGPHATARWAVALPSTGSERKEAPRSGDEGSRAAPAESLFDMHCHLDFTPDARAVAHALAEHEMGAFSVTVTPQDYLRASELLAPCTSVRVGLGLHPWWIAEGRCDERDVVLLERLARSERFIGEIGLDFARDRVATREVQIAALARVAQVCAEGGKVLSIHAVRSAKDVLDVLERCGALAGNTCIFHWFSGTSDELQRALSAGCLCSINPRMLATKRGRAYAQAIPVERLLLETDAPSEAGGSYDPAAEAARLVAMLKTLANLRRMPCEELAVRIAQTSRKLLELA